MAASKKITQDAPIGSCHFESWSREKFEHDDKQITLLPYTCVYVYLRARVLSCMCSYVS